MRRLTYQRFNSYDVQEALNEFSERAEVEFGVKEEDIVSITLMPPIDGIKIFHPEGSKEATCSVFFVYWVNN